MSYVRTIDICAKAADKPFQKAKESNLSAAANRLDGETMTILAYVLFKVSSGTEREVCQKLVEFAEVIQADLIFGEYDVIAKMETEDLDALESFLSERVRTVPNVLVTSTMIISREYKGKNYRPKNK
ncbi:MAG: Lrp/AsnC ligand binding domain-containing protein [Candidatus Bathyarchaeota archaeon]|nr:Lrp/AsnC ligand binding domain-containing protein [Candidatus Bathyarchaeota archaeon]